MRLVQITPGAGGMYCGNCLRDNALVAALRQQGHDVLMVPLYLPMTLDEADQSAGTPVFFGGISVYLEQQSALFRRAPRWLHSLLASPRLLRWAAGRAAKTRAADVADLTLSMLRGEEGHQAAELDNLIAWLRTQPRPDVVCLSNALLSGLARRLQSELGTRVAIMLQGEDAFLDAMPEPRRTEAWETLAARAREADLLIAPSRYFAELMARRLRLPPERVRVVFNGINLDGYPATPAPPPAVPTLGFFARMCPEKGLDTLVEAWLLLRKRGKIRGVRLHVGGSCGPGDEDFVNGLRRRIADAGATAEVAFHPNLSREEKISFLRGLSVFSVPARYGEAFGLYLLEALAAGVPVAQPRTASFPEILAVTGGGVLCEPDSPEALAGAIEPLLADAARARVLGMAGREAVQTRFHVARLATDIAEAMRAEA